MSGESSRRARLRRRGLLPLTSSPTSGWVRLVRVAALGGSSMLLAALAHLVGDGRLPAVGLMVLLTAAVGTVAVVATSRRCRLPRLLTLLVAEQLALHEVFAAASGTSCPTAPVMGGGHGGPVCGTGVTMAETVQTGHHALSLAMVLGHLAATVLTAWVLTRGEAALWRLADRVTDAARPPSTPWPSAAPRTRALTPLPAPHVTLRCQDAAPRGPPLAASAVG
jgi:hypothetical protein